MPVEFNSPGIFEHRPPQHLCFGLTKHSCARHPGKKASRKSLHYGRVHPGRLPSRHMRMLLDEFIANSLPPVRRLLVGACTKCQRSNTQLGIGKLRRYLLLQGLLLAGAFVAPASIDSKNTAPRALLASPDAFFWFIRSVMRSRSFWVGRGCMDSRGICCTKALLRDSSASVFSTDNQFPLIAQANNTFRMGSP